MASPMPWPAPVTSACLPANGETPAAARNLAAEICLSAPLAVAAVMHLNRELEGVDILDAMKAMRNDPAYRAAIDSEDAKEGPASFAEKRPPRWTGR